MDRLTTVSGTKDGWSINIVNLKFTDHWPLDRSMISARLCGDYVTIIQSRAFFCHLGSIVALADF